MQPDEGLMQELFHCLNWHAVHPINDMNSSFASPEITSLISTVYKLGISMSCFALAGIDTSNIVEGGRRSRARVDYSAVLKSQVGSDSEGEEEVNRPAERWLRHFTYLKRECNGSPDPKSSELPLHTLWTAAGIRHSQGEKVPAQNSRDSVKQCTQSAGA